MERTGTNRCGTNGRLEIATNDRGIVAARRGLAQLDPAGLDDVSGVAAVVLGDQAAGLGVPVSQDDHS